MKKKVPPKDNKTVKKVKEAPKKKPVVDINPDESQDACLAVGTLEYKLLQYLYGVKMVMHMKELAKILDVSHSRVTRIMDILVQRKLVTRRPSEEDRRCWYAEITESGNALALLAQKK